MLKKVQKKLQKETLKKDNEAKIIANALDRYIDEAKRTQMGGDFTKVEDSLFEVKVKFKSKYVSKNEYNQLLGMFKYLLENPKYDDGVLRKTIRKHPIKYGFLIECDTRIDDFFSELKKHGAYYIATSIENERSVLQDLQRKIP